MSNPATFLLHALRASVLRTQTLTVYFCRSRNSRSALAWLSFESTNRTRVIVISLANFRTIPIARKCPHHLQFLQLFRARMAKLLISFEKQNVRLGAGQWLFEKRRAMRFQWLAFLAFKRLTVPGDQAWVTLEEIARLPGWSGRSRHHVATNVGRYLKSLERTRFQLVTERTRWAGPYRLNADALSVSFDIPLFEVRRRLLLRPLPVSATNRDKLIGFTFSYARAQWLYFRGRLSFPRQEEKPRYSAYDRLTGIAGDRSYGTTLRLLACLSAVDVLYRFGRFRAARRTLLGNIRLLHRTQDLSLKARFYLKLAWAYQRASTSRRSDRAVEDALRRASSYAENSGDRDSLGLLAHRTGGYLTKKRRYLEAVGQYSLALEAYLITGNYDMVQATCGNLGSAMHRLGPQYYPEVRRWLLLSLAIARWMRLGRDDAHAEMILGKIYIENGERNRSRRLLKRAERVATLAGNRVNLADIKMVSGFWYQRFGTRKELINTLVSALNIFRSLTEFDTAQKEKYMELSFPEVWPLVMASAGSQPS